MATETWIINETFDAYNTSYDIAVSYTSGGRHFDQISFGNKSSTTYYALIYSYKDSDGIFHTVMPLNSGNCSISGYRTIIFDSPVTDANLLNWLQTRAVKNQMSLSSVITSSPFFSAPAHTNSNPTLSLNLSSRPSQVFQSPRRICLLRRSRMQLSMKYFLTE